MVNVDLLRDKKPVRPRAFSNSINSREGEKGRENSPVEVKLSFVESSRNARKSAMTRALITARALQVTDNWPILGQPRAPENQ